MIGYKEMKKRIEKLNTLEKNLKKRKQTQRGHTLFGKKKIRRASPKYCKTF